MSNNLKTEQKRLYVRHGLHKHPLYKVWSAMTQRCENPKNKGYKNYGARGIKVCGEWHDFKTFYTWCISNGHAKGLSLERINNDRDYCPDNCKAGQ